MCRILYAENQPDRHIADYGPILQHIARQERRIRGNFKSSSKIVSCTSREDIKNPSQTLRVTF